MPSELDVLRIVSERLEQLGLPFMLTGSFAMAYYATPRMTRDLDLVVGLEVSKVDELLAAFSADFYFDADRMFNLMHLESGIKVDIIVKKATLYRDLEFRRRQSVSLGGIRTWLVSREDLILSKLAWARDSSSELQMRDVRNLLTDTLDLAYLKRWAPELGVSGQLDDLLS